MKILRAFVLALFALLGATPALADFAFTAVGGNTAHSITTGTGACASVHCWASVPIGTDGTAATDKAASTAAVQTDTGLVVRNPDLGTIADTAWVSGNGTIIALLKNMAAGIALPIPDCAAVPCTNKIGVVGVNTWAGGTLGAMANYGTSPGAVLVPGVNAFITNTPAVTLASTTITGTVASTQSGAWTVQPGNTPNTSPWLFTPAPTAGQGCTSYHLSGGTTASTNANNIKASAVATACRLTLVSTAASLGYLKLYDLAATPTCSSATGLKHVYPIPAGTTGAGIQVVDFFGEAYTNGLGFCVTGGGGDTDNTNGPAGIFVEGSFK